MRPRLELAAPLVQVDLLLAEAEREPSSFGVLNVTSFMPSTSV